MESWDVLDPAWPSLRLGRASGCFKCGFSGLGAPTILSIILFPVEILCCWIRVNPKMLFCISGKLWNFFFPFILVVFLGQTKGMGREKPPGTNGFKIKILFTIINLPSEAEILGIFDGIESPGDNNSQFSWIIPQGTSKLPFWRGIRDDEETFKFFFQTFPSMSNSQSGREIPWFGLPGGRSRPH